MNPKGSAITPSQTAAWLLAASFALAIIALTIVNKLTEHKISQTREQWLSDTLSAVLPPGPFDNSPLASKQTYRLYDTSDTSEVVVYTAFINDRPAAAALELLTAEGYSGNIKLLIGLKTDGSIIGVRIIEHQETPGLGDRIEYRRSSWITQFDHQSLTLIAEPGWRLSKMGGDFDGLTGATVTSIAVLRSVHQALRWFEKNKQTIFNPSVRS